MKAKQSIKYYRSFYEISKELSQKQFYHFNKVIFEVLFYERHIDEVEFNDKLLQMLWISIKHSMRASIDGFCSKKEIAYDGLFTTLSKGLSKGLTNKDKEKEKDKDKDKEKETENAFNKFWNLYDKKVGNKSKLLKKFAKLSKKDIADIMNYLPKYKTANPNKQYRKNPETFLNNKSWNDEIISKPDFDKPTLDARNM